MTTMNYYAAAGMPNIERMLAYAQRRKAESIIAKVCAYFGVNELEVRSKRRDRELVVARQWAMFFIHRQTRISLRNMAAMFSGRDHSTAIHSLQSIEGQIHGRHYNRMKEDYPKLLALLA